MQWLTLLVDAIIVMMVLEFIGLGWLDRVRGQGVRFPEIRLHLLSGLALMSTLRAALSGAHPAVILLLLGLAGALHALDIRSRWRR